MSDSTPRKRMKKKSRALVSTKDRDKPARRGRAPGTKIDKETGLSYKAMHIAEKLVDIDTNTMAFSSAAALAKEVGEEPSYVRKLFKDDRFQAYLWSLMEAEQPVLEHLFSRGLALGLMAGDPQVMRLYAQVTGKLSKNKKDEGLTIRIVAPDGAEIIPKIKVDSDHDIINMEKKEDSDVFEIIGPDDD